MQFRLQDDVLVEALHDEPDDASPASAGPVRFSDRLEKIDDAGQPEWLHVRVVTSGVRELREGFIRSISLVKAEQAEPEPIEEKAFFRQISFAATRLCANQDYLFAVASAASGLSNTASVGSSAAGPFRFLQKTWNDLVKFNGEENDITEDDIVDPGSQAVFAAILSLDAQNDLTDALGRMPAAVELFFAHLFGIEAAASILTGDRQAPIIDALRNFYSSTPQDAQFANNLIQSNAELLTGKTVAQVLDQVADKLSAGLERAAKLAADLGLKMQPAISAVADNNLPAALRAAIRHNEIGENSPYKLSFAGKGNSGASFGFMQGDLAAKQPAATVAFRRALAAADIAEEKISALMQRLSVPLSRNPLSDGDAQLVDSALDAPNGRKHVDAMDEEIFSDICQKLDKCTDVANASGRTITPEAQIYMVLWINMTGPPTDLLDWLSGKEVRSVPAPGATVDRNAVEAYLRATKFFTENPRNLDHCKESALAGVNLLRAPADAPLQASIPPIGIVRISAARPDIDLAETESIKKLVAIVGEASKELPEGFRVLVTSAMRRNATVAGTGGRSQHAEGNAIDVSIVNPAGQAIPNKGTDFTGLYKKLAIAAFRANETKFPERSGRLAWGGNFTTGPRDGPRDLMHFDYGGDRGSLGPGPRPLAMLAGATATA